MTDDVQQLTTIVADLIEVLHLQAKEMERLIGHVEQMTTHLGYPNQMPTVASELSDLHHRIQTLRGAPR